MPGSIQIRPGLEIPEADLTWSFSRSGGPGGQHVNTADTRARLHFALSSCTVLFEPVKDRLREQQPAWITAQGDIVITSSEHRSRLRNIETCERRLVDAILKALKPPKQRRATKPSRAARRRRVDAKKKRAAVKSTRRRPKLDD